LLLVLDTNEYLFVFGADPRPACEALLTRISSDRDQYQVRISRAILNEVRRNLSSRRFKDFWSFVSALEIAPDEDWEIPFELGVKYESKGLKPGDAFIAAYTEWTGAEYLITENRDFMDLSAVPFGALRAEAFLRRVR
jgi:predicted nucleic acid-binding protein